jgi:hypothetical protein
MSPTERAVWSGVMRNYQRSLAIAKASWSKDTPPAVIQAATATVLLYHKDLTRPPRRPYPNPRRA